MLQFKAKMDTQDRINMERRFVISFFLADDTLTINEEKIKNSGIDGGKFLERKKLRIPSGERYFVAEDFALGRVMEINRHRFLLTEATEFTLSYMEEQKVGHTHTHSQTHSLTHTHTLHTLTPHSTPRAIGRLCVGRCGRCLRGRKPASPLRCSTATIQGMGPSLARHCAQSSSTTTEAASLSRRFALQCATLASQTLLATSRSGSNPLSPRCSEL